MPWPRSFVLGWSWPAAYDHGIVYEGAFGKRGIHRSRSGTCSPTRLLLFDPGERWEFGINIDWVGQTIEHLTQRERLAAMHERQPDGSLHTIEFEMTQVPEFFVGGGGELNVGVLKRSRQVRQTLRSSYRARSRSGASARFTPRRAAPERLAGHHIHESSRRQRSPARSRPSRCPPARRPQFRGHRRPR